MATQLRYATVNANDNNSDDPLPFINLAAITANAVRFLLIKGKKIERADERERQEQDRDNRIDRPEPAAFMAGIKSPAVLWDGGVRQELPGSEPADPWGVDGAMTCRHLDYVAVSW